MDSGVFCQILRPTLGPAEIKAGGPDLPALSRIHACRALWLASKMGLHGVGFPVDRQVYSNLGRARRREQIARLRAFVDVYGLQMTQTNPL